jgi:hypothetical protein
MYYIITRFNFFSLHRVKDSPSENIWKIIIIIILVFLLNTIYVSAFLLGVCEFMSPQAEKFA